MKTILIFLLSLSVWQSRLQASDRAAKEAALSENVKALNIADGILDVYKDTNSQITVYIGGRGSATASLAKMSRVKAEDHALRLAEAGASQAFAAFIKKNVDAVLNVSDKITDSSLDVQELMSKMSQVTENKQLAGKLRPEDQAEIVRAIIDTLVSSIRNSTGIQSVSTLEVKTKANEVIRGLTLFGSNTGASGEEIVGVKIFKWSPGSATFAAKAELLNKRPAGDYQKGAERLNDLGAVQRKAFISSADDF